MRRAIVLATAALTLGMLGSPAIAVAPRDVPDQGAASLDRISGQDRFETAALTATRAYPDGADTVVVATGLNFPDALSASYLSGGTTDAPVLLVAPGHIPDVTLDAMGDLDPSRVVVLGGREAVGATVVEELRDLVGDDAVRRIGGTTRIETAALVARRGGAIGSAANLDGDGELVTAIVARADQFPDALAAGPLAHAGGHPILLTMTDELPQATIDVLTDPDLGIEQVIISGGTAAVSADVESAIADLDGIATVHRVTGQNRTATAVAFGELTRSVLGWDGSTIALARGDAFPDALTIAPLAAQLDASLFLARTPATLEGDTFAGIQALCGVTDEVVISGGTAAISTDAAGQAKLATICADHAFTISGDQNVQGGDEDAAGTGWLTIADGTVCVAYDVEGLDGEADMSHIHEAPTGEAGDVVVDLGAPDASGFLATCTDDAAQAQAIQATPSDYYVNIHTPDLPLGAARGQVDGDEDLRVALTGEAEVEQDADGNDTGEPVDEPAEGTGTVDLFFGDAELCYQISVSGLTSPVDLSIAGGFHIHEGAADANGGVVLPLPQSQSATDYAFFDCVDVDQAQLDEIIATPSDYYLNLHTVEGGDPDTPLNGTLRGQLG